MTEKLRNGGLIYLDPGKEPQALDIFTGQMVDMKRNMGDTAFVELSFDIEQS